MMNRTLLAIAFALACGPALAQPAPAPAAQPVPSDEERMMLARGQVEALRANSESLQKSTTELQTLTNRMERVETAVRNLPPSLEGLRTDIIAIRAALERLASGQGVKRPAATLRFGPFACGNETAESCAANACKSVGYGGGIPVSVNRRGNAANGAAIGVQEATCFDQ